MAKESGQENLLQKVMSDIAAVGKDLAQLRVTTVVGTMDLDIGDDGKITLKKMEDETYKVLDSRMDLIDGDILNFIDKDCFTNEQQSIRDFHDQQVKTGRQVISDNLKTLIEGIKSIQEAFE